MLSQSQKIQKIKKYRDHGNSTMTKEQRDYVKGEVEKRYITGEIKDTKQLKIHVITLANQYYTEKNKGKPVSELRKSTFYDFLRENNILLPKKFKKLHDQKFPTSEKMPEEQKIKLEDSLMTTAESSPVEETKEKQEISSKEKPVMVSIETQTEDDNLFQYVVVFNQVILAPLKQIKGGIIYNLPSGNLLPTPN